MFLQQCHLLAALQVNTSLLSLFTVSINPCDGSNAASVDKRHSDSKTESADEGLGWEKDSDESNASSSSNVSNMKIDFEGSDEINGTDSSTNLNETKQMIGNENEPSVLPEDNALLKNLDFKNVTKELDARAFKELAAKSGFQFGDCFSLIERAWSGENQALVRLRIPKAIEGELSLYVMHPCIIDACLQSCIAIGSTDPDRNVIPVGTFLATFCVHFVPNLKCMPSSITFREKSMAMRFVDASLSLFRLHFFFLSISLSLPLFKYSPRELRMQFISF